jgi:hypothetical protein
LYPSRCQCSLYPFRVFLLHQIMYDLTRGPQTQIIPEQPTPTLAIVVYHSIWLSPSSVLAYHQWLSNLSFFIVCCLYILHK